MYFCLRFWCQITLPRQIFKNKTKITAMLTSKDIGNKIAEARKNINISQAQLAEQLFISPQAVGKWERGESMPDIVTLNRLADILGVSLIYFSESFKNKPTEFNELIPEHSTDSTDDVLKLSVEKANIKPKWDMSSGNWLDADFSGLKNLHEKFSSSNLQRCQFIGSDLSKILLKGNHVVDCNFSNSNINNSHFQNSHIVANQFQDCSLQESEFSGCHIKNCDFNGANFTGTRLKGCDFSNNKIEGAVWMRSSFIVSQLSDVVFEGTLEDCSFENCSFKKVTFQHARLINTFFKNKSLKRIKFVDCQVDRMTYAFLKNGKADLSDVRLLASEDAIE